MPSPTSPGTFSRPDLGQAYEEFDLMAHVNGFVGLRLMPMTSTGLQAGTFSRVKIQSLLKDDRDVKRAPGAGYNRSSWEFEADSFACEERGAEELLDDRERAAFGFTGIRFDMLSADRAVAALMRNLEVEIATLCQNAAGFPTQTTAVGTEWDTAATATPVNDVLAARESFKSQVGIYPNGIVLSEKVMTNVVQTAEVQDYVKYGATMDDPRTLAESALAKVWRIPNVIVSSAVRSTANPGQPTAVLADIWDDEFVSLIHIPQGDDLRSVGFGRTFAFQELVVEQYREEKLRSDVIRARFDIQVKTIHTEAIHILSNITT